MGLCLLPGQQGFAQKADRSLTVDQCVELALRQNLAVESVKIGMQLADADIDVAKSYQDGKTTWQGVHEDSELPSMNVPSQGAATSSFLTGDYARRYASGTTLGVGGALSRLEFADATVPFEELYIADVRLKGQQSLLDNAWGRQDRARVEVAESGRDQALARFMAERNRVAARVHQAYWRAYTASNLFLVNERALQRARELLEKNRSYFEDGLIDETGLIAAEASLAQRDVDILSLENRTLTELDLLKEQINLPYQQWNDTRILFPESLEAAPQPLEYPLEQAMLQAFQHRPDLRFLRAEQGQLQAQLKVAGERGKSDLSVFGEVGVGNYADDFGDSLEPDRSVWSVGARWETPTQASGKEAELRKVRLGLERNLIETRALEQTVARELRQAIRELSVAYERRTAARRARELQQKKLALEEAKFEQGRSITALLIEYQDDLSFAELAEVKSVADLHATQVRFDLARGMLVDHSSVEGADPVAGPSLTEPMP